MANLEVLFYEKENGDVPVQDFLLSLDNKMRAKMVRAIALLEEKGTRIREPISKPLDDGIFELRAQISTDISRVLYFFVIGKHAILTHGFIKKTQKTPKSEIERAKRYRSNYLKRSGHFDN